MTAHPAHRAPTRRSPRRLAAVTAAAALTISGLTLAPAQAADPLVADDDVLRQAWTDGNQLTLTLQGNLLANDQAPADAVVTEVIPVSGAGEPDWDLDWSPDGDVTITHVGSWGDGNWEPLGEWQYIVEAPGGERDYAVVRAALTAPSSSPLVSQASVESLNPATIQVLDADRGPLSYPVPPSGEVRSFEVVRVVSTSEGVASASVGGDGQSLDVVFDPESLGDRTSVEVVWRLQLPTGREGNVTQRIEVPELERPFELAYHQPGLNEQWSDGGAIDLTLEGNRRVRGNLLTLSGIEPHPGVTLEVTGVTASEGWRIDSWTSDGQIAVSYVGSWADTWTPTGTLAFQVRASNGWTGEHHADLNLSPSNDWIAETEEWSHISLSTVDRGTTRLYPDLDRAPIAVPTDSGPQTTRFRATRIVEVGPGFTDARIVNDGRAVEVDIAKGIHDGSSQNSEYWLVIEKSADTGGPAVRQRIWSVMEPGFLALDDSAEGTVEAPIEVDVLANDSTIWQDPYREAPLDVVGSSLPADVTAEVDNSNNVVVTVPKSLAGQPVQFDYRVTGKGGDVATPTVTVTADKATQKDPEKPRDDPEPPEPRDPKKDDPKDPVRIDAGL